MDRYLHNAMMAQYAVKKASGDGLVSWEKGVKCVMPGVKLMGAATQGTLTGKNLFDKDNANLIGGFFGGGTSTITSSDVNNRGIVVIPCEPNTTYTVQKIREMDNDRLAVACTEEEPSAGITTYQGVMYSGTNIKPITITTTENAKYLIVWAYWSGNTTALDSIQIEKGSTATAYEPYCGGIQAPNPGYPIMPKCNDGMFHSTSPDGAWDGGTDQAPELWAIPGTDIRDEWDTQTGRGVRRCAVIDSYAGELITTPYISSTGELSEGAKVIYGISDAPFYHPPARLNQPRGTGQIIQLSGSVPECPIEVNYLTHAGGAK